MDFQFYIDPCLIAFLRGRQYVFALETACQELSDQGRYDACMNHVLAIAAGVVESIVQCLQM